LNKGSKRRSSKKLISLYLDREIYDLYKELLDKLEIKYSVRIMELIEMDIKRLLAVSKLAQIRKKKGVKKHE